MEEVYNRKWYVGEREGFEKSKKNSSRLRKG